MPDPASRTADDRRAGTDAAHDTSIGRPARGAAALFLFVLFCVLLIGSSTPRRVGDGVEYWAMTENLAGLRPPSVSRGDLLRLERTARTIDAGFDESPLRFPHLVGADGRQDFPHFWLYPLINVPGRWVAHAARLHPNWAFTLTNVALLTLAFAVIARHVSTAWSALLLAGPLIWWIDKAHGDVFTVSLLAMACAVWRRAPNWTLVLAGAAAAQNPALVPVWGVLAASAIWRAWRDGNEDRARVRRQIAIGIIGGGCLIALPLAYYQWHLGVWSPLVGYTRPAVPTFTVLTSFIADPNIGLVPNAPFFALAALAAIVFAWRARHTSDAGWLEALVIVGAVAIQLAGYAQSVNANHGATPSVNRWTLWLMPWGLLIASASPRLTRTRIAAGVFTSLAVLNATWAVWNFRPALPEVYRYPTPFAAWLWTHVPAWPSSAPEVFAERVSHREPPVLPIAWTGCTKTLLLAGAWPAPCLPTTTPPDGCLRPDRLCYATSPLGSSAASAAHTTFADAGTAAFPFTTTRLRWRADDPFMPALRDQVDAATRRDPALASVSATDSPLRAASGVAWTVVWRGRSTLLIYLDTADADAVLHLRLDAPHDGALIDLDSRQSMTDISVARAEASPVVVALPAVRHGLLMLDARRQAYK